MYAFSQKRPITQIWHITLLSIDKIHKHSLKYFSMMVFEGHDLRKVIPVFQIKAETALKVSNIQLHRTLNQVLEITPIPRHVGHLMIILLKIVFK